MGSTGQPVSTKESKNNLIVEHLEMHSKLTWQLTFIINVPVKSLLACKGILTLP